MPFMSVYNNLVIFDPKSRQNTPDQIVPELATEWGLECRRHGPHLQAARRL